LWPQSLENASARLGVDHIYRHSESSIQKTLHIQQSCLLPMCVGYVNMVHFEGQVQFIDRNIKTWHNNQAT